MSQINTQSTLATRLDEKKEREKQLLTQEIDLNGAKIPQNTPLNQSPQNAPLQDDFSQNLNSQGAKDSANASFKAFDNDEFNAYKQSLYEQQRQITQSDDLTPEQVEFAVNFSDESDELLKQGVSKKQMIEHLRKGDFLDKASWAMLDKQSGGNDDLIFDFFKQNADNLNPRKATTQKPQELKLYDTSEYEKELKTRGFLENTARNLAASFDEDFNTDKNEQNKIALNIKEKIKHGQNFNDLSDFEKDFLAYRGSLDEWQSVLSPLDSAQKTGKFYKPLTSAWNTLFKSDEQNAQDAFKNLQDELKNQNAYKQAFDKIQNGANFNDLSYDEKIAAAIYTNEKGREKEFYENMSQNAALLKEAYKDLKNTKFANVKSIDELSENEKKELYERQNVFSRAFAFSDESKNTLIQEELDEAKARKFKADFDLRKLGADLAVLEGFERKGLMTNAVANWAQGLFDKKGASEDEKKALQSYQNTMRAFGEAYNLDEIYADDKGRTHIVFEGQDFVIKDGGFQNFFKIMYESKFAVAGGVYGAIKGAKDSIKKGKISPKDIAYQSMKQSAIYSSVGGLGDYGVNIFKYDKDFDLRDALTYAVSEGVASVVGDAVVLGVGYGAKALYKGAKDGSLAQGARVVWQNTKKMADKISDNVVLAGFVKNLSNQNLRGAENLMAMNKDLKESINEAYERVGGRANVNETEFLQGAATSIKAKFGENSKEAKLAQGLCDIINLKSIKDRQKAMFEYIRADESGRSLAYLSEVANRSPQVQANLKTILNKTSYDLENKLKNLGIDEFDIKRVFDDFKNATGASYDEAMDGVLAKMYPSDIEKYRASVDLKGFEDLISHFENEKMLVDDASKIFKSDIVDALFGKANKDGTRGESPKLSFTQLNNIRKNLNAYTKRLIESRPSFQNTLSLKVQAQLRGAIDEAIKDIFRQNPTAFSKASELYTTALKDYAQMKDLMKTIDDLRVASGAVDEKQAVQAIVKYASGQGEENLANLTRLTQHLSDENKAVLEMNILQDIFNKSFFADKEVDIKVFDSAAFLDKLATLTGKDGQKAIFQSKAAKEFLKMVDDFHTLFKKDADIARRISPARSNNPFGNSNFATTASGKLAMLRIKLLFEVAMRNMPDVFWLPANWTNAFKSAALKYHLEHALTRSNTISEFKTNFTHNVKRSQHTPQTQRLIKQITQGLDGLEKDAQELAKMSDDELTLRGIFGENYAEFKGKGQEAINHLLETKSGQVQGAFHRDDLGEINLVWGQVTDAKKHKGYGLAHIVDKHGEQAARQIPQIIKDGKLAKDTQGRLRIETQSHIVGINDTYGDEKIGHWIVTSYEKKGDGVSSSTSSPITTPKVQGENPLNEIIPNSSSQSQAPQKSLLEQARENTERLRAAQEAEQIAQKEAELARLKEMQAKNAEILAQKEAAAGQAINEAQSLQIGTPIKAHKISDTKIIINDNTAPFKAEFIIAKKDDIKPNFERTGTQGRSERQDKVIESVQSDFKPHLIFEQMGGFEGLPIILKDGQVIAGNHRAQAIKGLTGENLTRYKQAAKEKFGIDLKDDEVIVRLVKDGDEKELINLAFMSNVGRESNLGEKALANLAKYDSQIQALPSRINADSVFELESQVAKALDTQGNGLNVFDTNLALFSRLAKSTQNANILDSLNTLKNLSQDEKEKVLRMFVSNAGEFHNLAKDTQLKSLNLNDYLADALIVAAKNVDSTTRAANYAKLLDDIITMQASAKEMLKIDPFLFENFKSKALGYALARFARLENPSAKLFEFLKASKADLENLYTGNIFESNKAISDIDIYDFLKHAINSGEDLIDKQGRNIKGEITSRLDDLRKVENALIDSGEIQFAKSKAKPKTIKFIDNFTQNSALFKTLDNEKQQAILKIKEIEAEKMPDNLMNLGDFENLQVHFSGKADEAQRQKYAPLFDITTQKPDIKLKTSKDGQERTEYIKAFQHKESKDMFYIAITQENDKIKITGIPTTQISKVVNDIIKSEKVLKAGNFETISNPAELNKVSTLNDIIPKIANKFNKDEIWAKNLYEWHKDSSPLTKEADGTPKVFYHGNKDNGTDFEVFMLKQGNDTRTPSAFFSSDENTAKSYIRGTAPDEQKTFKVFLNVKNPLIIDFEGRAYIDKQELADKIFKGEQWFDLAVDKALQAGKYDGIIFKNVKDNRYGADKIIADTIAVFDSKQIKSIDNTGKFDSTNDNILFALGKAKPQGREAKETNINSLFADDELQMQATKPTRELNLSDEKDFNELSEFFALNSKDKEFNEIFAKATKAAQRLGVKVRFDESAARSHFVLNDNTITIAAANKEHFQAQDLLHELIHATTRKALKDFNENPAKAAQTYTKRQIEAIKEIISLYQKSKGIAKRQGKDAYALQNVDEFVAELSSGEFRAFLKAQDIFERFIKALIRFFTGDSERLAKNVNSYKALKESYYKILDDYEPQVVEKSQSQLEFEMAQRQIGELKAQKAELLSQMRPPITQAVREEIKEKAKKLNKEIERTFLKAKLTQKIGKENLTSQRLEQARKNNERIIVDKLDSQEAQKLGFDEPEFVAQSIDGDAINHTLNRHGEGSELVRNGQPAVTLDDIAKYPQITKIADETLLDKTKEGLPAKVSFKQINGYYVVVEEVHKGQNELSFKTMYKGKGDYKNSEAYTTTLKNSKGVGASPLSSDLKSAEFYLADKEIIPNSQKQSQVKANSMLESKKAYDSELKRLNNELEYTETLLRQVKDRGIIDNLNKIHDEILAQKRELLKQDPFKFQKVSQQVSHINQNNDIMSEISHKGGQQDGTSNASNGLNAAEKGMPTSEPERISDGLFGKEQLSNEPRGAGADFSNSPTHRQQPQTLFSQGASEPNASGGQQRGSNERLRTASGDLRGEVSGDGQNLQAQQGLNVSERFGQDRSEQHSRAKHTIRANSSSGASHSNATAQELVSDTNAAGILSPAEKATIENQTFTQTIDPAKFNANEILSANINALKVLDELLITRNLATNEQKELLSAFSGAGGRFSDELNKIRKANPNDERLAYINGLLKQINENLPKASGEIVDKGLSITDFYARSGDAYFTPTHIVKAMSDLAKKMGLKDESYILEPSAGVGRFLGFFDDKHPYIHAVELDKLSANIARKLYPTAQIENAPFQNSLAARNIGSYDLIIGNPPYANVKIQDKMIHDYFMLKSIENLKENGISIQIVTHNFMDKMSSAKMQIAKNAEFLGGVRLPNDTFKDAKVTTDILVFRKLRADEVGTADTSWTKLSDFENGLKVSSYFKEQKPQNVLGEFITQKGQFGDSVGVKSTGFDLENLDLSKFIKESKEAFHTEKMHLASTQLAEPQKTGNFYKENGEIFQNGQKVDLKKRLQEYGIDWADSTFEKRIGDFKAQFDNIQELKNTLLDLQKLELVEDFETPKMKALRAKLNAEFNKLVGKDGSLYDKRGNAKAEFSVFSIIDDTSFEIFALQDAKGAKKADIFTKRINYPYKRPMSADSLDEAMQISRNEYGKYNIGRMSDLLNKSKDEVQNELLANKFLYIDSSGKNVPKDEFLSGDVKTKLERFYDENGFLKFSDDENVAKWQRQAFEDLKAVIPKDIELPLINIPLGATFLDKRILNEFLKDELGLNVNWLDYKKEFGWELNFNGSKNPLDEFVIATSDDFATNTGIRQINALSYLNDMLNNKTLQVKRSVKQQDGSTKIFRDPIASQQLERMSRAIEQRFMDFIQNHAEFAPLALRQYNDTFNRWVARKYDGSHLEFIGKNRDIDPRPHQKNGVYRILNEAKTLLAHAVGTGKTYTMGLSAVEAKRLGIVSKPMIATPNNVAPQLAKELRKLYPNARIKLVQGVSKKTKNLQLAELKKNDYDIIVCSMTAFESMNVSPSAYKMYYDTEMKQLLDIERQLLNDPTASKKQIDGIAKRIENLDKKINDYLERVQKDGQSVFFDDIGVDMLLADEAHYFKSLPIITKQYNVRGIGSANSNRAIDAYIKIHSKPDMKVVFATGTPITNYISDIYVLQRFLGAERLRAQNMEHFDEWSKMHARTSSEFELKSTGEYKLTTRLRDFTNLPELQMAYLEFADIVSKDDMLADLLARGLKPAEPPIKYENTLIERSQAQSDFMKDIVRRSEELAKNSKPEKGGDNHLKIISDTNKASLDMRLINPSLPRDENGKIAKCAENILKVYKEFDEHKGTQLVFLDTSTPKSKKKMKAETKAKKEKELAELQAKLDEPENYSNEQLEKMTNKAEKLSEELESHDLTKFSAYEDLKELLIQKGIKEDEIAFIHDYDTEKKALELNRKINDGEIRVLLGSTKKMGAGSNFQERLAAIHNLDLDWTPANMEQRLGRIERQGNSLFENIPNFEARVFNYLTKEMSDSLMLQVLSRKQKLIKQLQKRDISLRQLVDTSEDNLFGQLQAASSPYAKQLMEIFSLQNEVSTLENALKTNQSVITSRTNYINKTHKELEKIERQKEFLNRFENTKGSVLEVSGKSFDFDDKEATKAINDALYKELTGFNGGVQEIATLKGFKIIAKEYPYSNEIQLFLGDTLENAIAITQNIKRNEFSALQGNKTNFVQRFNNVLKTKPKEQLENAATKAKDELAKAQKVLDEYKNKDLSDEKRQLNDKLARLDELNLYVGRVDKNSPNDATIARLEARYGKEYHKIVDIVREKIDKENADEVLDISFAPKRSDESALSENLGNFDIMPNANLNRTEKVEIPIKVKQGDFKTLQTQLDEKLKSLKNTEFINDETGIKASLASNGIGEILANVKDSVKNGFTFAEHFATAYDLENIFKTAKYQGKFKDNKHGDLNVSIHRFKAFVSFGEKHGKARLTLKEWRENGKRIYSLKLESLEK